MNPLITRIAAHARDFHVDAVNIPPSADTHPENWRDDAACKGRTDDMFPAGHKDITYIRRAKAMCRHCPVQQACLAYALEFPTQDMHGVWAGYTSRQLAQIQRRMGIRPTRPTIAQMWND